jgi:hypothetical protein
VTAIFAERTVTRMQFRIRLSLPKVGRTDDVSVHGPLRLSGRQRGLRVRKCRPDEPGLVVCDCSRWPGPHYRLERAKRASAYYCAPNG